MATKKITRTTQTRTTTTITETQPSSSKAGLEAGSLMRVERLFAKKGVAFITLSGGGVTVITALPRR